MHERDCERAWILHDSVARTIGSNTPIGQKNQGILRASVIPTRVSLDPCHFPRATIPRYFLTFSFSGPQISSLSGDSVIAIPLYTRLCTAF